MESLNEAFNLFKTKYDEFNTHDAKLDRAKQKLLTTNEVRELRGTVWDQELSQSDVVLTCKYGKCGDSFDDSFFTLTCPLLTLSDKDANTRLHHNKFTLVRGCKNVVLDFVENLRSSCNESNKMPTPNAFNKGIVIHFLPVTNSDSTFYLIGLRNSKIAFIFAVALLDLNSEVLAQGTIYLDNENIIILSPNHRNCFYSIAISLDNFKFCSDLSQGFDCSEPFNYDEDEEEYGYMEY